MAANELLENIVKYSSDGCGSVQSHLALVNEQPTVRIYTRNVASHDHLQEASRLLAHIIAAPNPQESYQRLIASSGERTGEAKITIIAVSSVDSRLGSQSRQEKRSACRRLLPLERLTSQAVHSRCGVC